MAPASWTMLRGIGAFELILITAIIIYDLYRTKKAEEESDTNKDITIWVKSYRILTYIYITFVYIHSLNLVLSQNNVYDITDSSGCWIRITVNAAIHQMAKSTLYILLITRLMASYANTIHQYSLKKVIIPFYIFIALHFIYTMGIGFFRTHTNTPYNPSSISACDYIPRGIAMAIWQLWDIVISVILLVLFLKPLHKLLKNSGNGNKSNEPYFVAIISKTSVLTSWVIISTFVCIFVYVVINSWIVLLFDNIINILSVLLMKGCHENLYDKFCGKCGKCCCLCLCCCGYRKNLDEMNLAKIIQTGNKKKTEKSINSTSTSNPTTTTANNNTIDIDIIR